MLIDEDPSLVALSMDQGYGSKDETDFLKPNQQFPSVDGKRSVQVYLSRMREALEDYQSVAGKVHLDDFVYAPFHTPFPGMVRKAALFGVSTRHPRHGVRGRARRRDRSTAPRGRLRDREAYEAAISDYMDAEDDRAVPDVVRRAVEPTLGLSERSATGTRAPSTSPA